MLKSKLKESKNLIAQLETVYTNKVNELQIEYEKCDNEKQQLLLQIKSTAEGNLLSEAKPLSTQPQPVSNQNVNLFIIFYNT